MRYFCHVVRSMLEHVLVTLVRVDVEDSEVDSVDRNAPVQERHVSVIVLERERQWYLSHFVVPLSF